MTKLGEPDDRGEEGGQGRHRLCQWCGRALVQPAGAGRPRRYCTQSCRQQAYVARRTEVATHQADQALSAAQRQLDRVNDAVALLERAIADLDRADPADTDPNEALSWLLVNAREAVRASGSDAPVPSAALGRRES